MGKKKQEKKPKHREIDFEIKILWFKLKLNTPLSGRGESPLHERRCTCILSNLLSFDKTKRVDIMKKIWKSKDGRKTAEITISIEKISIKEILILFSTIVLASLFYYLFFR